MASISIIIPCYNAKNYLERCIKSIAHQTYKDFELIIVDDCSQDDTIIIAERLMKEYNINGRCLKNDKNLGPSLTRKHGIQEATSDFIAFCDSDDWYDDIYLESMVIASDYFTKDLAFCNYKSIYSNGRVVKHDVIPNPHLSKNELLVKCFDSLWSMMIRKTILEKIAFPNIRNGEDMAIIPVIISESKTYGCVNSYGYNYYYHVGSLSKTFSNSMLQNLRFSFEYIEDNLVKQYPSEVEFLGIRNLLYGGILNMLKSSLNRKEAKHLLNDFETRFPEWIKNKYFRNLPKYKRIYLWCVKKRFFLACRIMSYIHKQISR
jgi:glycosyltransferase involved in cell wall biosynthesis